MATVSSQHEATAPRPAAVNWPKLVGLIFVPFALGYLVSYLYRTINALVAPDLTAALGLSAGDLGLLTSIYFATFALAQLPIGIALDRFGPRRVQGVLLVIAAIGSFTFGLGQSWGALAVGRGLIGLGVAGALMGGLKSIAVWFPKDRLALCNGFFIAFGGVGAYAAAGPSQALLVHLDWRTLFILLGGACLFVAFVIIALVPDDAGARARSSLREVVAGLGRVFGSGAFWSIAPASGAAIGAAWSVQDLWAGRWLADVEHLTREDVASHLSVMALALILGSLGAGILVDRLKRGGVPTRIIMAAALLVFVAIEAAIVARVALPTQTWAVFGAFASATVFGYKVLGEVFPAQYVGRANTALNLIHMAVAFGLQAGMGAILDRWLPEGGHYPAAAYQAAFILPPALQAVTLAWMGLALGRGLGRTRLAAG